MSVRKDRFIKILKEKGLKITNQRLLVLEVLAGCPDEHFTAEEIYEIIKQDYPKIGLATVYRTIQLLLEFDLIDRINLDDGFVRYEIGRIDSQAGHHHHHLICQTCGRVFSFDDDLLDQLEKRIRDTMSFYVKDHEVKFYGSCRDCMNREKEVR